MKTLSKGLAVLDLLLATPSLRTTDAAGRLGLDKGVASRILQTLARCGYAARGPGRQYAAGPKMQRRATSAPRQPGLKERARPLLQKVAEVTGESAHLGILADDMVLYLDRVDSAMPLRVDRPVGTLSPLYCTALGRIFLAFNDIPLPREMKPHTVRTVVDPDLLHALLRQVVSQGYVIDDEEFNLGIRCAAVPLREADGTVIAALGVSGPTARISLERATEFGALLLDIARNFR